MLGRVFFLSRPTLNPDGCLSKSCIIWKREKKILQNFTEIPIFDCTRMERTVLELVKLENVDQIALRWALIPIPLERKKSYELTN